MATYLGYPFDAELFSYNWKNEPDLTLTAMYQSGAVQENGEIANLISTGGDYYTIPFYKLIGGEPVNYDGKTDIIPTEPGGATQSGIVFGRANAWKERDFIVDYNSGADPMRQITSQVAKYWMKQRQKWMLGIMNGVFGVTGEGDFAGWADHTYDISATGTTVSEANKFSATTAAEAAQKASGDNSGIYTMAFMHSRVAANLAGLKLMEFQKYTDANGITRPLQIGYINGMLVIVDDGAPFTPADTAAEKYTTYLMGPGAIQHASAPVKVPVEIAREALIQGGYDVLVTRLRETMHPNGFSFTKPSGYEGSPKAEQLSDTANWEIVANPKSIAMARIITNG